MIDQNIPDLLRAWRARHGLSQSGMAAHLAMPTCSYKQIESGRNRSGDPLLRGLLLELLNPHQPC